MSLFKRLLRLLGLAKRKPDNRYLGKKKALVVGINAYDGSARLEGCVADAQHWYSYLTSVCGFEVRVLTDARATKENILHRLQWLCEGTKKGDVVAFTYSGHGARVRDRSGDELKDAQDECLIPIDYNWDDGVVLDDDIDQCLRKLNEGAKAYLVFDCCHSGTMTRELSDNPGARKSRHLAPPFDIRARSECADVPLVRIGHHMAEAHHNVVALSACQDNETAAEAVMSGQSQGAFSYFLLHMLREKPVAAVGRLIEDVSKQLKKADYAQTPCLTASSALAALPFVGPVGGQEDGR